MDISNLKEGGMSVRILPGPNGISFHGAQNAETFMASENDRKANVRDVSFSSFLEATNPDQELDNPMGGQGSIEGGRETARPEFANGLEKQNSNSKRLLELERMTKDSEISIFEAEKYFSAPEEHNADANHGKMQASKKKLPSPSVNIYDTHHPIASPASSIVASNSSFRPGFAGSTPSASSEASWNSQAGLLSMAAGNSARNLTVNNGTRKSGKWVFRCSCPCSDKRSVDIDDTLTESRRAPSVSYSMTSNALMNSSISSIQYSYPGLGKRVLSRSIEMQKADGYVDTGSEISDINSSNIEGQPGMKTLLDSVGNIQSYDREPIQALRGITRGVEEFRKDALEKENGFSFSALPVKSEEKPRLSLEVFHSPFTSAEDLRKHTSDLHKHFILSSSGKPINSFMLDSNSEISKFGRDTNGDVDQDKDSDSSADLFEIQSITTQATACHQFRKRDSMDENSSIQSSYPEALGYRNSNYHFGDTVTPSARSSCCEPSDASVDWSMTSGDTMDKASLGNFSLDYEGIMTMKKKNVSIPDSSVSWQRKSSGGIFMGCASAKAVNVALSTEHSHRPRLSNDYQNRGNFAGESFRFSREKKPAGMKAFSLPKSTRSNLMISGKRSISRTNH